MKTPVTTPIGKGFRSVNVQLRKELDLYANLRPCYNLPGKIQKTYMPELKDKLTKIVPKVSRGLRVMLLSELLNLHLTMH